MSKKVPMSLSVDPEYKEQLDNHAKKRGMTTSKLICSILNSCLVDEDEFLPIMLKVPRKLLTDKVGLNIWLEEKREKILNNMDKFLNANSTG